ncbi:GGDEF domain-containing protein [Spirillospora albida]|uniref:GGDEF domain-containing protein n=1 Tax=Spirillospora albida TaxID=58123 RepID=UPI00068C5C7F|nr:GGDEF domain-containing protein [Spirillospora albida]
MSLKRYGAFVSILAVGHLLVPDGWWRTITYQGIGAIALVTAVIGVRRWRPDATRAWWFVIVGATLCLSADLLYDLYLRLWKTDPFPSIADVLYLAGYVFYGAGLMIMVRRRAAKDRGDLIDAAIIAGGLGLMVWVFMVVPTVQEDGSLPARVVSLAYPLLDLFLLVLLVRLLTGRGGLAVGNLACGMLAGAFVSLLTADIVFAFLEDYVNGTAGMIATRVVDEFFLATNLLIGAAALHPLMTDLTRWGRVPVPRLSRPRLGVLTSAALLAPIVLLARSHLGGVDAWVGTSIAVASALMFVLVVLRMLGLIRQVETQAHELTALSLRDPLTGAANRRGWELRLTEGLATASRRRDPLCVALIDLDHFKRFNDTYGHQAGDDLLRQAVAAWQTQMRPQDVLARYGGEEFILFLADTSMKQAGQILERLRKAVPHGQTVSAGVAMWDFEETAEQLTARADAALYSAKHAGRDRVVLAGYLDLDLGSEHPDGAPGRNLGSEKHG